VQLDATPHQIELPRGSTLRQFAEEACRRAGRAIGAEEALQESGLDLAGKWLRIKVVPKERRGRKPKKGRE